MNGCCYGRESNEDKGDYLKLCGQSFWEFITDDANFYIDIVEPIGHMARERNEAFQVEFAKVVTEFTRQFIEKFCMRGEIDWEKILKENSGRRVKVLPPE